eukprot:PhF_6_TR11012/c0_g1_i1/m.17832
MSKAQLHVTKQLLFVQQHTDALLNQMEEREIKLQLQLKEHKTTISRTLRRYYEQQVRQSCYYKWNSFLTFKRLRRSLEISTQRAERFEKRNAFARNQFGRILFIGNIGLLRRMMFHTWMRWTLRRRANATEMVFDAASRLEAEGKEKDALIMALDNHVQQLEGRQQATDLKVKELEKALVASQNENTAQRSKELELENRSLRDKVDRLEGTVQATQSQVQQSLKNNTALRENRDALQAKIDSLERYRQHAVTLEKEVHSKDGSLAQLMDENDILRADILALRELVGELKVQLEIRAAQPALLPSLELSSHSARQGPNEAYVQMLNKAQEMRKTLLK